MYLFFFALLFIIFQYMNEKQIYESQENDIALLKKKVAMYEKDNDSLARQLMDVNYFTLQGNDNAMTYFEDVGNEASEVADRPPGWEKHHETHADSDARPASCLLWERHDRGCFHRVR